MSNERSNPDSADDGDRLVSAIYRDLANERTPQALNKSILRQATAASKQGYLRSVSWMRPMAWATTVGLCLAIVFEVTQVPPPESAVFDMPNDAVDLSSTEMPEKTVPLKMPPRKAKSGVSYKSDARLPAAMSAPERTQPAEAKRANSPQPVQELRDSQTPNVAVKFDITNQDVVRNPEDVTHSRNEDNQEREQAQRSGFSQGAVAVQDPHCNEVATATPVTWLECIEQLENAGLTDAAMTQRALMQRSFPDFAPR